MKMVEIEWRSGGERFEARGHSGVPVRLDAPRFDPASAPAGPSPSELLLVAAGACAAWDVVEILHKQRVAVDSIDVRVGGEQDEDPPWTFRDIRVHFTVRGRDIDADRVEKAVRLSESTYCSVIATVRGAADVTVTSEVVSS